MSLNYIYTPDVPQPTQAINNTQQPINFNFQDIGQIIEVNHIGFNTADIFGTHTYVNFITQSSDPVTLSNEMCLYSKTINTSNGVELFYRYPNNGSVLQLTGEGATSGTNPTSSGGGTFSPIGGINSPLGGPNIGSWQYLSNGVLIMTWIVNNGQTTSNPMTIYFPSPTYSYTTAGSTTMPQFTQSVFNIQISSTNPQGSTSSMTNYGVTIIDKNSANVYWTGSAPQGTQGSVVCTAIGI
jgi:hypothetical protein